MSVIEPIKVPKWGLAMEEGAIVEWHVKEGDRVSEGDDLVDIETTKITNVCEAHREGVIKRIVAQPGQTLPVGALIAVMAEGEVSDADIDAFVTTFEENFDPDETASEEASLDIAAVDIGGGRSLRVGASGKGHDATPFVLLHGFGGDIENWTLVQEALAATHPVYAIELPGHGQSTKDVGDGRLEDLAGAATAAIDALDIGQCILVGHSLGGAVSVAIAAAAPDRFSGLGLVCPAMMPGGDVSADYLEAFVAASRARDLREPVSLLFDDPQLATRDMLDQVVKMKRLDGAQDALTRIKDNMLGDDPAYQSLSERLQTISAPITLIACKGDRIVGAPDAAQFPAQTEVFWVESDSHMPQIERVDVVIEALKTLA